jgi:hypothetical protein
MIPYLYPPPHPTFNKRICLITLLHYFFALANFLIELTKNTDYIFEKNSKNLQKFQKKRKKTPLAATIGTLG